MNAMGYFGLTKGLDLLYIIFGSAPRFILYVPPIPSTYMTTSTPLKQTSTTTAHILKTTANTKTIKHILTTTKTKTTAAILKT